MKRRNTIINLLLIMGALGCVAETTSEAPSESHAAWMVEHTDAYLNDREWRRERLEETLWDSELPYAQKRLGSYALEKGGWELLMEMDARVEPVTTDAGEFLGEALLPEQLPETIEGWRALGERVFWQMPMRRDAYMEWLVTQPQLWGEVGLEADENGEIRGLTRFRDARGDVRVGVTCGLCHGRDGVAGQGHRGLDLGRARALFVESLGREPGVYATWGAGRVDVTDDGVDDPLAIQDLWGVPWLGHLNSSGSVKFVSPASLAVRFETQYIVGHGMETRPSRALIWALTMYVLTLDSPASAPDMESDGAEIFETRCGSCHDAERGYSGDLVDAALMTSDPLSAFSPLRGTGFYKTPSLIGVGDAGPYLHDGSQPSLEALLESGHPFGAPLAGEEQQQLINFLKAL